MRYIILFSLAVLLLSSCVSQTKMLQIMPSGTSLNATTPNQELEVNHVHTSVDHANVQGILEWPQVKQRKYSFLPLIVVTNWNSAYDCQIGLRDVKQNLPGNLDRAILWQLDNSLPFRNSPIYDTTSFYSLDVSVDSLRSNIPFVSKGTFVFALVAYTYWFREGVEMANMEIVTSYTLKQKDKILQQGTVRTARTVPKERNNTGSKKNYMKRYLNGYFSEMNVLLNANAQEIVRQLESNLTTRK